MPLQEPLGPNVKALIAMFMAVDAIPPGTTDSLQAGIKYLLNPDIINASAKRAIKNVEDAIYALRHNRVESTYHNSSDEEIAGVIIEAAAKKRRGRLGR